MTTDTARPPGPSAGSGDESTDADLARALDRTWRDRPGLRGWLTSVSSPSIGGRYIVTTMCFFVLAGLAAAVMRAQLARPDAHVVGPDLYDQLFSTHGTTMMFLFAVPVMTAMGLYLVPLMIGTRTVAFPRLNAFGYYTYLIGGVFLYVSFFANTGPDVGWFSYVPLAGPQYDPGHRADVWAQTVTFTEIAALVAAIQLIVTIFRQRAPGMSLNRMPLFVWAQLVTAFMIIFAMPAVATASMFLAMDRAITTHLFNPAEQGDVLLWQHLFWYFGHPEVYIIFLPALGMLSPVIETFSRRPIVGYPAMVLSMIATGFLAFGLWVHHMFATPLPQLGQSFFTAASTAISIPTGVQIFCWLATIWSGRPRFTAAMLFALGFFVVFVIGGLSGVMVASVPFDLQATDSYFIVAHLHYVLIGGGLFPLFAGFYYWFPKMTGRLLNERAGKWQFWLFFLGVNLTFFPMHWLGLRGMPRRVYTYLAASGWGPLNLVASVGAATIAVSVIVFLLNVLVSWRRGAVAGPNPWGSQSLEWATASPPPSYVFLRIPVVGPEGAGGGSQIGPVGVVTGLATDHRETLVTSLIDARPQLRQPEPSPTIWPFLTALAVGAMFIGAVFRPWAIPVGTLLALAGFAGWAWPRTHHTPNRAAFGRARGG